MTIDQTTGEIKTELPPTYTDLIEPRQETFSAWYLRRDVIPLHPSDPIFKEVEPKGLGTPEVYTLWYEFTDKLFPTTATSNHWRKEFREYVRHSIRDSQSRVHGK